MPIYTGKDKKGHYFQWGRQKKYYFIKGNKQSEMRAYRRAALQAAAIYATGYKRKKKY